MIWRASTPRNWLPSPDGWGTRQRIRIRPLREQEMLASSVWRVGASCAQSQTPASMPITSSRQLLLLITASSLHRDDVTASDEGA